MYNTICFTASLYIPPYGRSHGILTGLCKTLSLTHCRNIPDAKSSLCKHGKQFWRMKLILLTELVCETSPAQTCLSGEAVFTRLSIAPHFTAARSSLNFFFSVITCINFWKSVFLVWTYIYMQSKYCPVGSLTLSKSEGRIT